MDRTSSTRPAGPKIRINPSPAATGRPAARAPLDPAFAPPAARSAPAPSAPGRATQARPGPRPVIRTGAGFFTKAFIWILLLSLGALVGGAYLLKSESGEPLAPFFYHQARVKLGLEPPRPPPPAPPKLEEQAKFQEIVKNRETSRAFLDRATLPTEELGPEVAAELEKRIELLARDGEELATLSATFAGTGPEVAAHCKLQAELAVAFGTIKLALEKSEAAKEAARVKAAQPVIVEYDLSRLNPWAGQTPRTWARTRIAAGATVLHEDSVLESIGPWGATVRVLGSAFDAPFSLGHRTFRGGQGKALREESVQVGDAQIVCRVVDDQGTTLWIPKTGPLADRWSIKSSTGPAVTALGQEEIELKGERKACTRFEQGGATYWAHPDVPGFLVRIREEGSQTDLIDWGTGERPAWPDRPRAPEPAAETLEAFRRASPWSAAKAGMWTRRKAEYVSPLATSETAFDTTALEVGEKSVTLKMETLGLDGQVKAAEQVVPYAIADSKVVGEEAVTVGATAYPCLILETPTEKTWVAKGPLPAILKAESMVSARTATALEETQVRVGRHTVKCLHVTLEGRRDDLALKEEVWLSDEVPGLEVRRETFQQTSVGQARSTTTLVDFGNIPARKTAIGFQKEDPARLEEQRVLKVLDDAEEVVIGASVTFREIMSAAMDLPTEPAALRSLAEKSDETAAQLSKAKEAYAAVRDRAPQGSGVEEKVTKIDKALAALQKVRESIHAKLK